MQSLIDVNKNAISEHIQIAIIIILKALIASFVFSPVSAHAIKKTVISSITLTAKSLILSPDAIIPINTKTIKLYKIKNKLLEMCALHTVSSTTANNICK